MHHRTINGQSYLYHGTPSCWGGFKRRREKYGELKGNFARAFGLGFWRWWSRLEMITAVAEKGVPNQTSSRRTPHRSPSFLMEGIM
ncbi:hypothetical protein HOY82DRAFT_568214, partial [Tuber indicum]